MQDGVEIGDLYRLAREREVQIRRLNYKRDSLEDIFLKAMEGDEGAARAALGRAQNGAAKGGDGNGGLRA